ncbi:unnamed protein product [Phyllotreta striolata]|uniref:Leucine-rich repeat-containing protein 23 n=1 Tax=Phyllotreta striolata TaxID=444603 RepID=A0A9N9XSJ1_PHYSR|nr:unnamed protein product [Phyllotreta striolata]
MDVSFQVLEGEDVLKPILQPAAPPRFILEELIEERKLTLDEASKGLSTLGKDESGVRYAYLMLTAADMMLTDISVITNYNHLLFVDVRGNLLNLDALQVLADIPFLLFIRAERNRLESAALKPMPYLQVLILNSNAIIETGEIHQRMLHTLELSENQIFTAQFVPDQLESLKELSMAGNHLLDTSGTFPANVEKLYLCRNKIAKINTNFALLPKLQVLHLRGNNIRKLSGFSPLSENLTYLNLRNNKITKMREFRKLGCLPNLDTLIMSENPVCEQQLKQTAMKGESDRGLTTDSDEDEMSGEGDDAPPIDIVRVRLLAMLPDLKRINKEQVGAEERLYAETNKQALLDDVFVDESSEEETEFVTTNYTSEFSDLDLDGAGHPVSEKSEDFYSEAGDFR